MGRRRNRNRPRTGKAEQYAVLIEHPALAPRLLDAPAHGPPGRPKPWTTRDRGRAEREAARLAAEWGPRDPAYVFTVVIAVWGVVDWRPAPAPRGEPG